MIETENNNKNSKKKYKAIGIGLGIYFLIAFIVNIISNGGSIEPKESYCNDIGIISYIKFNATDEEISKLKEKEIKIVGIIDEINRDKRVITLSDYGYKIKINVNNSIAKDYKIGVGDKVYLNCRIGEVNTEVATMTTISYYDSDEKEYTDVGYFVLKEVEMNTSVPDGEYTDKQKESIERKK